MPKMSIFQNPRIESNLNKKNKNAYKHLHNLYFY